MVPILRTISVGGVLIALLLLVLAVSPPGGSIRHLARLDTPVPSVDGSESTEGQRFVMPTGLHRAARLEDLVTLRAGNAVGGATALSGWMGTAAVAATIPLEIGEASSTELPVVPSEELPPVIMRPEPITGSVPAQRRAIRWVNPEPPPVSEFKPQQSRPAPEERSHRTVYRRHYRHAKKSAPALFDLLQALFGTHKAKHRHKPRATAARN
jgi:hypothetical protein